MLLELDFALGDASDGNRDGTDVGDVDMGGTGCGLKATVEPDYSKPRDRVESESSRPAAEKS